MHVIGKREEEQEKKDPVLRGYVRIKGHDGYIREALRVCIIKKRKFHDLTLFKSIH